MSETQSGLIGLDQETRNSCITDYISVIHIITLAFLTTYVHLFLVVAVNNALFIETAPNNFQNRCRFKVQVWVKIF